MKCRVSFMDPGLGPLGPRASPRWRAPTSFESFILPLRSSCHLASRAHEYGVITEAPWGISGKDKEDQESSQRLDTSFGVGKGTAALRGAGEQLPEVRCNGNKEQQTGQTASCMPRASRRLNHVCPEEEFLSRAS